MKLILYILALVSIGAAAFFSMQNIEKHEEQLALTKAEFNKVKIKEREIAAKEVELQTEEKLRQEASDTKNSLIADKDIKETDFRDNTKLSASYDDELEELVGKKDQITAALAEIEKELEGEKVPLDQVEEFVTSLEDKKKELNKTNVALQEEVGVFNEAVNKNQATLEDFKQAQLKRRTNLNANGISSLITAVDDEWGFVVIKPHADSLIKQDSKLLVIRGNRHIGRLSINAIEQEAGRVLANIDYSSIAPGMRIRPGDRVILSKPLTQ